MFNIIYLYGIALEDDTQNVFNAHTITKIHITPFESKIKEHLVIEPSLALSSPRINYMIDDENLITFANNSTCLYIHIQPEGVNLEYKNIYEFMFFCRATKNTNNYYYMGTVNTAKNNEFQRICDIAKNNRPYNIVSGGKVEKWDKKIIFNILVACHILKEYNDANFLSQETKTREGYGDIKIQQIVSNGNHIIKDSKKGWVFNPSTMFIGQVIDFYGINSQFAGIDSLHNFAEDAEYRFILATMLKNVLESFLSNNETLSKKNNSVSSLIDNIVDITNQHL